MDKSGADNGDRGAAAGRAFENAIFASRWLLAPIYVGLIGSLLLVLVEFGKVMLKLGSKLRTLDHDDAVVGILEMIDLSLVANLVLMVMFAGYENFVSRFHVGMDGERLDWMGNVRFGDLKVKLVTSIVAISAIRLLELFLDLGNMSNHELAWAVGIHLTFVVSGLVLVLMERLAKH